MTERKSKDNKRGQKDDVTLFAFVNFCLQVSEDVGSEGGYYGTKG